MTSLTADERHDGSPSGHAADEARGAAVDLTAHPADARLDTTRADPSRVAVLPSLKGAASGRVPDHAFVILKARETPASTVLPTANDNARAGSTRARSIWRDLFFLAILAMTIVGAFWSGKLNATQRVIVVPGPSSDRHVVT